MSGARTVHLTTARPMQELPYDPCPGDVAAVRGLARWCREQADDLAGAGTTVGGWHPLRWQGEASLAAAERVVEVAGALRVLSGSVAAAADGLESWASRLGDLQARADDLDAEAVRLRSELQRLPAAGTDPGGLVDRATQLRRLELAREVDAVVDRAGALQQEYDVEARRHAALLDRAAPADRPGLDRWWRGTWDAGLDQHRRGVRQQARWMDWTATAASSGSAVAGVVSLAPPLAPVAAPVGAGLSLQATGTRAALALGAGGSDAVVGRSAVGTAVAAGGAAATAGAVVNGSRAADAVAEGATWTGVAMEVDGWDVPDRGEAWTEQRVGVDGEPFAVRVDDVAEPWHTGVGLRGHGFAVTATVAALTDRAPRPAPTPVTTQTPTTTRRSGPSARPQAPAPAGTSPARPRPVARRPRPAGDDGTGGSG